jgi:hypothetical protein
MQYQYVSKPYNKVEVQPNDQGSLAFPLPNQEIRY